MIYCPKNTEENVDWICVACGMRAYKGGITQQSACEAAVLVHQAGVLSPEPDECKPEVYVFDQCRSAVSTSLF